MFAPLRTLELKEFTLYFKEEDHHLDIQQSGCGLSSCDEEVHRLGRRNTYWMRRETRRTWAQEIRAFVLTKDS